MTFEQISDCPRSPGAAAPFPKWSPAVVQTLNMRKKKKEEKKEGGEQQAAARQSAGEVLLLE